MKALVAAFIRHVRLQEVVIPHSCRTFALAGVAVLFAVAATATAQPQVSGANAVYQQLRSLAPAGPAVAVKDLVLKRGHATFTFTSGSFVFFPAVNGHITGAVFHGDGTMLLVPSAVDEKRFAVTMNKQPQWNETFQSAVLRFTDRTADEIQAKSQGSSTAAGNASDASRDFNEAFRTQFRYNIHARLLADVLSPTPGEGFFAARFHGKPWNKDLTFTLDPHGAAQVNPEQEVLSSWSDGGATVLSAARSGLEDPSASSIPSEDIDVSIAASGLLSAEVKVTVKAAQDGLAVVPLDLYPTLRVSSVRDSSGAALAFIQEQKEYDSDLSIILPGPLARASTTVVTVAYSGKDVVSNEGSGNYYLVGPARGDWYPSRPFGAYAKYHMTFRVPKGLSLVATGNLLHSSEDGRTTVTEWESGVPIPVAGFNLGKFDVVEAQLPNLKISSYANKDVPDRIKQLFNNDYEAVPKQIGESQISESNSIGSLSTTGLNKRALAEGRIAAAIDEQLFGPLPYTHIALTQQTACTYGQSWPMLVFLPICSYWDTTAQHALGLLQAGDPYWHVVTAHEVAHQWWGSTVSYPSYRDQWMSEGFADLSASVYLQATRGQKEYLDFWSYNRKLLTEQNRFGYRPIDVGPVTMGYRLDTQKTGDIARSLIYPKGAFILHMLRMMMYSNQTHDGAFHVMMADFVQSYKNRTATTEDFKAIAEKHMTPEMDLGHNHRLDWFFNEYVYGTALPAYKFTFTLNPAAGGATAAHMQLAQSGIDATFSMIVPVYVELSDGRVLKAGLFAMHGNKTEEQTFDIPNLGSPIKRFLINYNDDVLCAE